MAIEPDATSAYREEVHQRLPQVVLSDLRDEMGDETSEINT